MRSCGLTDLLKYDKPLHILSVHLAELGLTISQKTVNEKSNEIPTMQELLNLIDIRGCMIVADALNCQTKTTEVIINNGGDYLLNAKGNQETSMKDIEDSVRDEELRTEMNSATTREMNGGRIEVRTAFVTFEINWIGVHLDNWPDLSCIGAINRQFTINGVTSNEWHYYISSCKLSPSVYPCFYYTMVFIPLKLIPSDKTCTTLDKNPYISLVSFARPMGLPCPRKPAGRTSFFRIRP